MKRKIVLKLATFVLFGLCLLSVQKAEAMVETRAQEPIVNQFNACPHLALAHLRAMSLF
jgi:hypothetical protein